jgi:hypothetical protein
VCEGESARTLGCVVFSITSSRGGGENAGRGIGHSMGMLGLCGVGYIINVLIVLKHKSRLLITQRVALYCINATASCFPSIRCRNGHNAGQLLFRPKVNHLRPTSKT